MNRQAKRAASLVAAVVLATCNRPVQSQRAGGGAEKMTLARLVELIRAAGTDVEASGSAVQFLYDQAPMLCVWDAAHDRMRILTPVIADSALRDEDRRLLLEADFHSALDARYATSGGVLYAVFIHPLSPLTDEEVRSAMRQVAALRKTYGSTYSSGEVFFGGTPPRN